MARLGTFAWTDRRRCLGFGHGVQSGGGQIYRAGDFLCHRPIGADGGRAVGGFGVERIRRLGPRAKLYLALMFVFYGLAILLVARAYG